MSTNLPKEEKETKKKKYGQKFFYKLNVKLGIMVYKKSSKEVKFHSDSNAPG